VLYRCQALAIPCGSELVPPIPGMWSLIQGPSLSERQKGSGKEVIGVGIGEFQ